MKKVQPITRNRKIVYTERRQLRITKAMSDSLRDLTETFGLTEHEIIREAIDDKIKRLRASVGGQFDDLDRLVEV